jgi:hypothetical protein
LEERTRQALPALSELLDRCPKDIAANWAYSRALVAFQREGESSDTATEALRLAISTNPHVPPSLLGEQSFQRTLPEHVGIGDMDEAVDYTAFARTAWHQTSGALP